jgi:hypothetical protein
MKRCLLPPARSRAQPMTTSRSPPCIRSTRAVANRIVSQARRGAILAHIPDAKLGRLVEMAFDWLDAVPSHYLYTR